MKTKFGDWWRNNPIAQTRPELYGICEAVWLAAQRSAAPEAAATWQPIATAPKDGTGVFAWREGWERPSWVRWILNPRTQTEFWNDIEEIDQYELEEEIPPTHWLPLPPLPQPGSGASDG